MNPTSRAFATKIKKLQHQIQIARLSDFSYPDSEDALLILYNRLQQREILIEESETFSAQTRNAVLREINLLLYRITALVGIIVRSASVRNAFELYAPFLQICKASAGNESRLILSSEWEYIPFTYPQTLVELPNFIVIGLPASESDNVLVFPTAGHELGHTIWFKRDLRNSFKARLDERISEELLTNRAKLEMIFPDLKDADFDQDIFAQYVKSAVFSSSVRQCEELFCDFVGLNLFASGYLFAFEYLVSPQIGGARSAEYPDTQQRATILETFARSKLDIDLKNYAERFVADMPLRLPQDSLICSIADQVVKSLLDDLFLEAQKITIGEDIRLPSSASTQIVKDSFTKGMPHQDTASLGDLINAAWDIFRGGELQQFNQQGRKTADYISDLVLKSAEISEIGKILNAWNR